jgi:hypothetical protein
MKYHGIIQQDMHQSYEQQLRSCDNPYPWWKHYWVLLFQILIVMIPFISNFCCFQTKLHHGTLVPNSVHCFSYIKFVILLFPLHQILNTVLPFIPKLLSCFLLFQILFSKRNFTMVPCVPDSQYCLLYTKFLILLFRSYQTLNTVPYVLNSRYWFYISLNTFHYDPFCSKLLLFPNITSPWFPVFQIFNIIVSVVPNSQYCLSHVWYCSYQKKECTSLQKSICTLEVTINSLNVNP